jgi:hypothetical protein
VDLHAPGKVGLLASRVGSSPDRQGVQDNATAERVRDDIEADRLSSAEVFGMKAAILALLSAGSSSSGKEIESGPHLVAGPEHPP